MSDSKLEELTCLTCGERCDQNKSPQDPDAVPADGDICLCAYCGVPSAYVRGEDGILSTRNLTDKEYAETMARDDVKQILSGLRMMHELNPPAPR